VLLCGVSASRIIEQTSRGLKGKLTSTEHDGFHEKAMTVKANVVSARSV